MDQKNLMAQAAGPVNPTTTGERPAPELAQLSEEALQLAELSDEALLLCVGARPDPSSGIRPIECEWWWPYYGGVGMGGEPWGK